MINRRAMTLIELLIVIGIIALLLGLVVAGFTIYGVSTEKKVARARLDALRSMTDALAATKSTNPDVFDDFFYVRPNAGTPWRDTLGRMLSIQPLNFTAITTNANDGAELEARTLLLMHRLATVPSNRTMINNMPVEQKLLPTAASTYVAMPTVPFMLDPWDKPLVYVPREGITGLSGKAAGKRLTSVGLLNISNPIDRLPDTAHGFWMSGGPDKKLSTGDDNIYSFEN